MSKRFGSASNRRAKATLVFSWLAPLHTELKALASHHHDVDFTTSPNLHQAQRHHPTCQPSPIQLTQAPRIPSTSQTSTSDLQDGRWRQFGLLVSCTSNDALETQISFITQDTPFCNFISVLSTIFTCANLLSLSPVYAVRTTLELQLLPSSSLPLHNQVSPASLGYDRMGWDGMGLNHQTNMLTAILRCHGLHIGHCLHLLRCCIRNCKVWCRYLCHGCPPT